MDLDVTRRFGEIYKHEHEFQETLYELEQYTTQRGDRHEWADNLRLLTLPDAIRAITFDEETNLFPDEDAKNEETASCDISASSSMCKCDAWPDFSLQQGRSMLRLTEQGEIRDCPHYVAVSYCWPQNDSCAATQDNESHYIILTRDGERASKAPRQALDRAIAYAANAGLSFIWMDQECIQQDDEDDKERGIQSMDLVYQQSGHPIGLLGSYFDSQASIDVLGQLVEGVDVELKDMEVLADVLELLSQDIWFTRTWILQESTAGGLDMQLLARHSPALTKPRWLGGMPDELQISIAEFLEMICWAEGCIELHSDALKPSLLSRLQAATALVWRLCPTHIPRSGRPTFDPAHRQTCNAAQAQSFMLRRQNSRVADRVAILSNLCNYSTRIDTMKVEKAPFPFTSCALALSIFNGDMSLMGDGTFSLSSRLAYSWGPSADWSLSTISYIEEDEDIVRLRPSKVTKKGLAVDGFVWQISTPLDTIDIQTIYQDRWNNSETTLYELGASKSTKAQFLRGEMIWYLLQKLVRQGHIQTANAIWQCTNRWRLGPRSLVPDPTRPLLPSLVTDILSPNTGDFKYSAPPFVQSEEDFREFFHEDTLVSWRNCQWLIDAILKQGQLMCGHAVSFDVGSGGFEPNRWDGRCNAIFDTSRLGGYVFTPLVPGARLRHITTGRRPPLSCTVKPDGQEAPYGCVLRGGEGVRGFWGVEPKTTSQTYVLV